LLRVGKPAGALIKQSVENLIKNHINIVGVVINNLERKKHDYYSQYYSHYKYYNYGYEEQEEHEEHEEHEEQEKQEKQEEQK